MEEAKKSTTKKVETKPVKKAEKKAETFIMKVDHLSWGRDNKNHFFANKKPLITEIVMGKYSEVLLDWIDKDWIEEGSYK